jgi:hypothetical protein
MGRFKDYVVNKLLNLGFIIYGGYVRETILRSIKNKERSKMEYNPDHFLFKPIYDIDCICNDFQFKELTSKGMEKYSDLKFSIKKSECCFVNENIEYYTGFIFNKINPIEKIKLDIFICKYNYFNSFINMLSISIDYLCNKLCMQKINGINTYALLSNTTNTKLFINVLFELTNLVAYRNIEIVDNHRIHKMLSYGYKVDISYTISEFEIESYIIYLYLRTLNDINCIICESEINNVPYLYANINNKFTHFKCYIDKSIEIHNMLKESITRESTLKESFEPVIESSEISFEKHPSDVNEIKVVEIEVVEEKITNNTNEDEDLMKFIQFTKSKEEKFNTIMDDSNISNINNTIFIDGVAVSSQMYDINVISSTSIQYHLCTDTEKIKYLIKLENYLCNNYLKVFLN